MLKTKYILCSITLFLNLSVFSMDKPPVAKTTPDGIPNIFDIAKKERLTCYITSQEPTDEISDGKDLAALLQRCETETGNHFFKSELEEQLNPGPELKIRKTAALLKESNHWRNTVCAFDQYALHELQLLKGLHSTPAKCLIEKIKTGTHAGQITTASQLLCPLTEFKALTERQEKIQKIKNVYLEVTPLLQKMDKGENDFLAFWQLKGEIDSFMAVLKTEEAKLPFAQQSEIIQKLQDTWNKSEVCLEVQALYPHAVHAASLVVDGNKDFLKWQNGQLPTQEACAHLFGEMGLELQPPVTSLEGVVSRTLKLVMPEKWAQFLGYGASIVKMYRTISKKNNLADGIFDEMKARMAAVICMQEKLIKLNEFLKKVEHLGMLLENTQDSTLMSLGHQLKLPDSPSMNKLKDALSTATFQGKESWCSHWGRIKATYKLINECKKELLPLYATLGELDFLNAAVGLISTPNPSYCLPTFIEGDQPGLKIEECWNILRDADKSVTNSFVMGHIEDKDNPRSLVITGPNGKGKTENMLAPFYAALMAQTIGVAPGKRMLLVPCQQFLARLNAETNTHLDQSLFMADAARMANALKKVEEEKGITFVVKDEPGIGTKAKLGRSLVKVLLEEIGQHKNTLCLTTTHFDKPTTLAEKQPHIYANVKAVDGFKLEPGVGSFEKENEGMAIVGQCFGEHIAKKVEQDIHEEEVPSSSISESD